MMCFFCLWVQALEMGLDQELDLIWLWFDQESIIKWEKGYETEDVYNGNWSWKRRKMSTSSVKDRIIRREKFRELGGQGTRIII